METETREVTEQDVEHKPDEQDTPAPEATTPEQPEPETPAEPEQKPDEAKELVEALKPKPAPKRKPKPKKAKAAPKPKAKPKAEPKDDKDKAAEKAKRDEEKRKQELRDARERYTQLNEQFKRDGSTAGMRTAMRNTCAKLDRNVPKWAEIAGKGEKKESRLVNDEDLRLAHKMNALVFRVELDKDGRFDPSKVDPKKAKFGAPYVTTHVEKIREAMGNKDILKQLKISRKQLEEFAVSSSQLGQKVELPEETRKAIREFMKENFKPIDKIWARKFAGGAVVLLEDRARKGRKAKAAAKKRSTPTATKTAA